MVYKEFKRLDHPGVSSLNYMLHLPQKRGKMRGEALMNRINFDSNLFIFLEEIKEGAALTKQ